MPRMQAGPVFVAIMRIASCYMDRNDERVPDHLARIAYAIAEEAQTPEEAAALLSIGKHEANFCLSVQDHYTHSGGWSTWQLEGKKDKYPGPFVGLGYEPIHHAAYAAIDVWRHSHQCGQSPRAMFTGYAGKTCDKATTGWPTLQARVNTYWYALGIIKKEMKKSGE